MAGWYSGGTVTVTNGSTVVTGAGTDFVNNVAARDAFALVGGNPNEIASVQSATQLTLARPWLGASGAGQAYVIIPTVGVYVDLALRALNMLGPFQAVLDGVGQGLFGDGSLAAPAMRFAADQDSGFRRIAENAVSIVTGGGDRLSVDAGGNVGLGTASPLARLAVALFNAGKTPLIASQIPGSVGSSVSAIYESSSPAAVGLSFETYKQNVGLIEAARIDNAGNLLIGRISGSTHTIGKGVDATDGVLTLDIRGCAGFTTGGNSGFSSAAASMVVTRSNVTSRSINAAGTINASGADYAEYLTKAPGCGTIAKGEVCGVDRDGLLTRTWADAVRFAVKSTDPNLVGGDTWAAHLPPRPEAPGDAPIAPIAPTPSSAAVTPAEPIREDGEDDDAFIRRMAAYLVAAAAAVTAQQADAGAMAAYQADLATYPHRKAEHDAAVAAYEATLAGWEDDLETARLIVDRIAFSGQVPVNVDAATLATCEAALADSEAVYLVSVARGGGIGVTAVREGDMTLPLYMRRVGAVWAIRDGRPWVDVQHG